MTCRRPQNQQEIDVVDGRLRAYLLYEQGSVCWSHPCLSHVVVCPQPNDIENPNTYHIPTMCSRKRTKTVHNDYSEESDCWTWGTLHAEVESLFLDGWTCEPHQEKVNVVTERIRTYQLYKQGPVSWSNPLVFYTVVCPQPEDLENPNTYYIPTSCSRKSKRTVHNDYSHEHDCWDWGALHAEIENLFRDGWTCEPYVQ